MLLGVHQRKEFAVTAMDRGQRVSRRLGTRDPESARRRSQVDQVQVQAHHPSGFGATTLRSVDASIGTTELAKSVGTCGDISTLIHCRPRSAA